MMRSGQINWTNKPPVGGANGTVAPRATRKTPPGYGWRPRPELLKRLYPRERDRYFWPVAFAFFAPCHLVAGR